MTELLQVKSLKEKSFVKKKMDIECNKCGACCQAFFINVHPDDMESYSKKIWDKKDREWLQNIIPISVEEAMEVVSGCFAPKTRIALESKESFAYRCPSLEEKNGEYLCSIHEDRPSVCRDFMPSWMGDRAYLSSKNQIVYSQCSYFQEWGEDKDVKTIHIAKDFSDAVGGRYRKEGPFSAEELRDDFVIPALEQFGYVNIVLDGLIGIPTSSLEELAGGIVRKRGEQYRGKGESSLRSVSFICEEDPALARKAHQFMSEQWDRMK